MRKQAEGGMTKGEMGTRQRRLIGKKGRRKKMKN
jgi:hypothetical protein